MTTFYKFGGGSENAAFGALPDGDYNFVVSAAEPPYQKNDKWVMSVKIMVEPHGVPVFANPWTGNTSGGEFRDGIGDFLLAINRAPQRGAEPAWAKLVGAKGKCRLKTEIAQMGALAGKPVNKVNFWHKPHQLTQAPPVRALPQAGPKPPTEPDDLDMGREPQDIPFRSKIYQEVKRSRLSRRYVQ